MARIFLGISSSAYEDADLLPLTGTIADGQNIQRALLNRDLGKYDKSLSRLLLSPTLSEVQGAIKEILFDGGIECFTLYFAGHGISYTGVYYLCMRDTLTNKLSATALPLNYIFNVINETRPLQTNIIIDACEAGGLVGDLASLIKPEVFGNADSPSVSLLGSCMRDQTAGENDSGGFATQEILKHITGDIVLDTRWPFLDLVQIGRSVSVGLKEQGHEQTPVVWGLSLTGISTFSKNPHFQSTVPAASTTIAAHTFIPDDLNIVQEEKEKIWEHYLKMPRTGVTLSFIRSLVNSVKDLQQKGMGAAKIGSFLLGTAEGFAMRVAGRPDAFSEIEVLAACGVAFLPIIEESDADQSFTVLLDKILQGAVKVFEDMDADLSEPNALLSNASGLNDFYFLPIRISKILGWLSLVQRIKILLGSNEIISDEKYKRIIEKINTHYMSSYVCVSDEQSPYLMIYTQIQGFKSRDETFLFPVRCYISDFFLRQGRILHSNISGENVLHYLISRRTKDYTGVADILAQPSELLSVILDAAACSGMDEEVDPHMKNIDHMPLNILIPNAANVFADTPIEDSINITMQIGSETRNGVFTLDDFRRNFENFCSSRILSLQETQKEEAKIAMILSSFMIPDRVAWIVKDLKNNKH